MRCLPQVVTFYGIFFSSKFPASSARIESLAQKATANPVKKSSEPGSENSDDYLEPFVPDKTGRKTKSSKFSPAFESLYILTNVTIAEPASTNNHLTADKLKQRDKVGLYISSDSRRFLLVGAKSRGVSVLRIIGGV